MNQHQPNVLSEYDTIEELAKGKYSLARYGDREWELVFNTGLHYFKNKLLLREKVTFGNGGFFFNRRLKKVLQSNLENLLIGIPNIFNNDSQKKWKSQYYYNNIPRILNHLNKKQQYASMFFIRYNKKDEHKNTHWKRVMQIWENKKINIINFNKDLAKHPIFSSASEINFIECDKRNTYGFCGLRYKKL